MRVGIDIRVLASNVHSGIEEYTERLLENLLPLDKSIQFILFYSSYKKRLKQYEWLKLPNVKLVNLRLPSRILWFVQRISGYPRIDKMIGGVDVFFSPHFLLAPLSNNCRRISVIHDLSFERYPEFFSWRRRLWHKFQQRPLRQTKLSDTVITVSDSTKNDVEKIYDVDPVKIKRIYSGANVGTACPSETQIRDFRRHMSIPERYLFSLGTLEPRKNIIGILDAFEMLKKDNQFADLYLLIAGSRGWLYKEMEERIKRSIHSDKILLLGPVNEQEKLLYLCGSQALVYPSFFEGFGFPPLEAMKCGIPVIVSGTSSLPEVVQDAGILVDPKKPSSMALAFEQILTDKHLRAHLAEKGIEQSQKFSWQQCAIDTLGIINGSMS